MIIKDFLNSQLKQTLKEFGVEDIVPQTSFSQIEGVDFQTNVCMILAKQLKQAPMALAEKVVSAIRKNTAYSMFDVSFANPGFINFKFTDKGVSNVANELYKEKDRIGIPYNKNPKNIIFDYGGANVAKELHMGHLRSPIIGESLKRLNVFFGNKCVTDTHLGDWGLQMGLTIAGLEEDGVLDYYFKPSANAEKPIITLDMLNETYPKASSRSKVDADFKKKADNYTLMLQQKRKPYYDIWQEIRNVSVNKIKQNYKDLNAEFDLWYGESTASPYISTVIDTFKEKNLVRESEGALVVDVAKEGEHIPVEDENGNVTYKNPMPPAVIQKFNGGELYITTDLATIVQRMTDYPDTDEIVYITDARQGTHFEQLFRCARKAWIVPERVNLVHVGFGTINGKDGKPFKTRNGGMIKLDDVVQMLKEKAQAKLEQNNVPDFDNLALKIGVAAMKFGDLSNMVTKDYVFDLDKFMSFEGKTGPYLQYTATRINSLLYKAKFNDKNSNLIFCKLDEEHDIIISIIKLQDALIQAQKDNSLHAVCLATYNLCSAYSKFYNNIRILSEQDELKKNSYLNLSYLVLSALKVALGILAIDIPDKM